MMRILPRGAWIAAALLLPSATAAQEVPPLFQSVPSVLYETYRGVNARVFTEYFEMLVNRYAGSPGYGWGIYSENATVQYRITALPDGLASMVDLQRARGESFQNFTEDQVALWNSAWGTRHAAVYNAAPTLSVVPEGFTVDDIRGMPYNRVTVYHLKWDEAPAFRAALAERSALDRQAGIENFVLTTWTGGVGTEAQTVMIRVSAENRAADAGENARLRREARASYREDFGRHSGIMNASAWHIERHDQTRRAALSFVPGN